MLNRFRVSLSQPSRIGQFLKDKAWLVILYILCLSILCAVPSFISVFMYDGFTTSTNQMILDVYEIAKKQNGDDIYIPLDVTITDSKLTGDGSSAFVYQYFGIGINEEISNAMVNFNFLEDKVNVSAAGATIKNYSYEELKLDNVAINDLENDDESFKKIAKAFEYIVDDTKGLWGSAIIFSNIFANAIGHLIFTLIISVLLLFTSMVPFKYIFKLALYATTIYQIVALFGALFGGLNVLTFIGAILGFIYTKRAMRNIIAIKR